jgi:hypothetical protein
MALEFNRDLEPETIWQIIGFMSYFLKNYLQKSFDKKCFEQTKTFFIECGISKISRHFALIFGSVGILCKLLVLLQCFM